MVKTTNKYNKIFILTEIQINQTFQLKFRKADDFFLNLKRTKYHHGSTEIVWPQCRFFQLLTYSCIDASIERRLLGKVKNDGLYTL